MARSGVNIANIKKRVSGSGVSAEDISFNNEFTEYIQSGNVQGAIEFLYVVLMQIIDYLLPKEEPVGFQVGPNDYVEFSKGNLQYQASTNIWRFAENQYDIMGVSNDSISETNEDWIDLFGWGTSGYNGQYPYLSSYESSDYDKCGDSLDGTDYDWGVYNSISNGDYSSGWRTLTKDEWAFLFEGRNNAEQLRSFATVNGQKGYVFLPNNWQLPDGLNFTPNADDYSQNTYSISDWELMEENGAIFLPCAGSRMMRTAYIKPTVYDYREGKQYIYEEGLYWSTDIFEYDREYAYGFCFSYWESPNATFYQKVEPKMLRIGYSVRLVRDLIRNK